ncbi:hypothetical protein BCR32DRAFT_292716 [Anaeromyces robustus]|uniref:Uncharacterized protein n=1 Tax=Anaeromyces robustus TaxID=1754192 RepID=A0A1Y1X988_9FUNG|nr:hypothetical protein BCR32DRAFT_292716 [Anaeromyces robustus]|eukprot:ORX82323.1 hypothetical protein BCR32DRAFT_292716 [Anaeromyces robustus]
MYNPKIDSLFKQIFGYSDNEDIAISLINAVLPDEEIINKIDFFDTRINDVYDPNRKRGLCINVYAKYDEMNYTIIIQINEAKDALERSGLITSRVFNRTILKEKIYYINFLYNNHFPGDNYYHHLFMHEFNEKNISLPFSHIVIIELKKIKKKINILDIKKSVLNGQIDREIERQLWFALLSYINTLYYESKDIDGNNNKHFKIERKRKNIQNVNENKKKNKTVIYFKDEIDEEFHKLLIKVGTIRKALNFYINFSECDKDGYVGYFDEEYLIILKAKDEEIKKLDEKIKKQDEEIKKQDEEIKKQDEEIKKRNEEINKNDEKIKKRNEEINKNDEKIKKRNEEIKKRNEEIKKRNEKINKKNKETSNLTDIKNELQRQLSEGIDKEKLKNILNKLRKRISEGINDNEYKEIENLINELSKDIDGNNNKHFKIKRKRKNIQNANENKKKNKTVIYFKDEIDEELHKLLIKVGTIRKALNFYINFSECDKDGYIGSIKEKYLGILKAKDEEIKKRDEEIKKRNEELKKRDEEIKKRDEEIKKRNEEIKKRDEKIKKRNEETSNLTDIKNELQKQLSEGTDKEKFNNIINKLQKRIREGINDNEYEEIDIIMELMEQLNERINDKENNKKIKLN